MRIAIDLTPTSYHLTGIERFALCITEEMIKADRKNDYYLLFKDAVSEQLEGYVDNRKVKAVIIHGRSKLLLFQVGVLCEMNKIKADRFLFLAFPAPILFLKKNQYSTLHDMGNWDFNDQRWLHRLYFRVSERTAAAHSRKIFTVSEFSKKRIQSIMKRKQEDIIVTYNGISKTITDNIKSFQEIHRKYSIPNRYIMYLSTLQPRKNLKILLEAYTEVMEKVDYNLVLVGRNGWQTEKLIRQYGAEERIRFTGFVEDEDLGAIYHHALCFVFPSLYEGFGIPPVEALACGTPVISSDSSCMPEILGERAVFFKNNDIEDLKGLLLSVELKYKDFPRSLNDFQKRNYSYAESAKKILRCLESI